MEYPLSIYGFVLAEMNLRLEYDTPRNPLADQIESRERRLRIEVAS